MTPTRRRRRRVRVNDPGKLAVLLVVVVCSSVLLGLGRLAESSWLAINLGITGYMFGNGLLASKGRSPAPTLSSADDDDKAP